MPRKECPHCRPKLDKLVAESRARRLTEKRHVDQVFIAAVTELRRQHDKKKHGSFFDFPKPKR